jgi:hypothetical protein
LLGLHPCGETQNKGLIAATSACGRRLRKETQLLRVFDHAIRQIISKAMVSDEVVDIFAAAGLKKPDISILSDEFLAEVRGMPQRNLAVELPQKLLKGEIRKRSLRNVVQGRVSSDISSSKLLGLFRHLAGQRCRARMQVRKIERPGKSPRVSYLLLSADSDG